MTIFYNKRSERNIRKRLRKNMPQPEQILWSRLKGKQIRGYKFRRQYSIGKFIIDFYCVELKLAIEIDGESHHWDNDSQGKDKNRQRYIESFGVRFLRFTNFDIGNNLEGVIETIYQNLP